MKYVIVTTKTIKAKSMTDAVKANEDAVAYIEIRQGKVAGSIISTDFQQLLKEAT
jgi:hypothetical protein